MDYKVLKANRELVKGFLGQRIIAMQKEGFEKTKIIDYYIDLLKNMKNEELFVSEEVKK